MLSPRHASVNRFLDGLVSAAGGLPMRKPSHHGRASGRAGFVWLLASAHQVVESFGGFNALFFLKLANPIRNVRHHFARGFALCIPRCFYAPGSFAPLGAL